MSDIPNFAKLVPGFDFLQGLVKNAGSALPSMGQWVAPTLNPEELQKRIDAAITTDPTTIQLLLGGDASLLLDMVTYEETQRVFTGGYQFTGLLTRRDMIVQHSALVQKMVDVMVRTNLYIATHSAAEISAVLPADIVGDRYVYVKSLEHSRPAFSRSSLVTPQSVANNVQSLITFGSITADQHLDPSNFYDMSFVMRSVRQ